MDKRQKKYFLRVCEAFSMIGIIGNTIILITLRNTVTYEELPIGEFAPTPKSNYLTILHYNPVFTYVYIVCGLIILLCELYRLFGYKNGLSKHKTQGFVETPTIKSYMKSHLITNITDGIEEIWDESMGEIPYEYYNMIVVEDDGEGNIIACHFGKMTRIKER